MAVITVTVVKAVPGGVAPSPQTVLTANTYEIRNSGKLILHFLKTGAGVATITIVTPITVGGLAVADQTVSVPATTGDKFVALPARDIYNDGSGNVTISTDDEVGLTVDAVEI